MVNANSFPATSKAGTAGLITLIAGLLFFIDFVLIGSILRTYPNLRENIFVPTGRMALWVLIPIGLSLAPIGLLKLGIVGDGWKRKIGIVGTIVIILGCFSYILGVVYVYIDPARGTRQIFTPLGSVLLTTGMLAVFVAVYWARVWQDWRRFVPLLIWVYFPLQFPLQAIIFLGENRGPNPFLLGTWGLCWAALGFVIWQARVTPIAEPR